MNQLDEYRKDLDLIDKQMAELFEKRMNIIKAVAIYKVKENLNTYDSRREQAMFEKNSKYIQEEYLKKYYNEFLKGILDLSKEYQIEIRNNVK